jgi:hypothetical protein
MYFLRISFTQLEEEFARIKYLTKKACDHNINDADRSLINRQLQSALRNYDMNVKDMRVMGVPFFVGEYAKEPKILVLGEPREGRETVEVKVASDDWTLEGLGISKIRVDNFVNARKAETLVDKCLLKIKIFTDYMDQKDSYLSLHRKTLEMEQPDFSEVKSGKLIDTLDEVEDHILGENVLESFDPDLLYLRALQEERSKEESRESGLLLNLVM